MALHVRLGPDPPLRRYLYINAVTRLVDEPVDVSGLDLIPRRVDQGVELGDTHVYFVRTRIARSNAAGFSFDFAFAKYFGPSKRIDA